MTDGWIRRTGDQGDHGTILWRGAGRAHAARTRRVSRALRRAQVPYTDIGSLAAGAGERGQLYMDYCHLTPEGARAVAERMLPVVVDKYSSACAASRRCPAPTAVGPV